MNTECVIISKNDTHDETKLHRLASIINERITYQCELYPYTISEITKTTAAYNTYDAAAGWEPKGKKTTLNPGDKVLFVGGKLHYMNKAFLKQMFDAEGNAVDHIWSPLYRLNKLPQGKLDSNDRALHHTGDDLTGDQDGDDGLDNEIITVDLNKVNANVNSIVFFLNIYNNDEFSGDFSEIPYASIRMYEGTPSRVNSVFAQYDVATKANCYGKRGLILGKLYRHNGDWKFAAIGDAFEDRTIVHTIARVMNDYSK